MFMVDHFLKTTSLPSMPTAQTKLLPLLLLTFLLFCRIKKADAQQAFRAKFQDWIEDNDRMRIKSWYFSGEETFTENWKADIVGLIDTMSGATPNGYLPDSGENWLNHMRERREAFVGSLTYKKDEFSYSFEFGLSDESDYVSRSYALSVNRAMWEETLNITGGFSFMDDRVNTNVGPRPKLGIQKKRTPDFFIGIERLLDPKTVLSLNFTYGRPEGYLSDPYKGVQYTDDPFPGSGVTFLRLAKDNRPDERETFVGYLEGKRYLEKLDASIEASYRFFADDRDLVGHTFDLQWFQRFGDSWVLRPAFRYYRQDAANYYIQTLDGTGIDPFTQEFGSAPYFSSDYRITDLETLTYGVKLTYFTKGNLNVDIAFDKYDMRGLDGVTSQLLYPDAKVYTVGLQLVY
jgi:hypothetical protein